MKVFEEGWLRNLERRYHYASKYTTPFITKLALNPVLSKERAKIEEWFQTLPEDVKPDILGRLRSKSSHQHFSAYYELVLYEFFRGTGYTVTIHPKLEEGEPDLLVAGKDLNKPIIIEVATVFDNPQWEKEEQKLGLILEQLNKLEHHFFVMVSPKHIPDKVDHKNLKRFERFVRQWLDSFDPKITHEPQRAEYQADGLKLKLTMIPRKTLKRKTIVGGGTFAMFPRNIQLRRVLKQKINKYKGVKELESPFIIAPCLVGMTLDEENIIGELFGKERIIIIGKEIIISRDFSGLLTPKPGLGGEARNTRLSAVLEVKSEWSSPREENAQAARAHSFRLIHNPFASTPLDHRILEDYPQFVPIAKDEKQISLQWIGEKSHEASD
jgi:hypothetical protein